MTEEQSKTWLIVGAIMSILALRWALRIGHVRRRTTSRDSMRELVEGLRELEDRADQLEDMAEALRKTAARMWRREKPQVYAQRDHGAKDEPENDKDDD